MIFQDLAPTSTLQDEAAMAALRVLHDRGYTPEDINAALETLQPVPTTRVRERQAMRGGLDIRVRTEAGKILQQRGLNPEGHDLDRQRLGRTNFVVMKAAIDRQINGLVGRGTGERHEFSRQQLEQIDAAFPDLLAAAINEVISGN